MKVLITGAGGMVGSHLVERLIEENNIEVLGTYYKPTVALSDISEKVNLKECDVRYYQNVLDIILDYKPDVIYHLAAQSYPSVSWERPSETFETNVNGTINVFEAVKHLKKHESRYNPVVVVACSSAEYGQSLEEIKEDRVLEDTELKPLHPYGVSKVAQDLLAYQYYKNDGIKVIRARIFNTTGVRKKNDVTSDFLKRALEIKNGITKEKFLRVGNLSTQRAILDVRDLVEALIVLSEKGSYGEAYNISSEKIYKISEIVDIINKVMGVQFETKTDSSLLRPTDEKIIVGDTTKLKKDTGWNQQYELEATVSSMVDYYYSKQGIA